LNLQMPESKDTNSAAVAVLIASDRSKAISALSFTGPSLKEVYLTY